MEFNGIEITADNYQHLRKHLPRLSDTVLEAEVAFGHGKGFVRIAAALLQLPYHARADVESDGIIAANMTGGRHSDRVEHAVRVWLAGDHSLRYVNANREMLLSERAIREATGRRVILEPEFDPQRADDEMGRGVNMESEGHRPANPRSLF